MISLRVVQEIPEQLPEVDLPGGVAPFLRAFFSVPQGVQMAGGIAAALIAILLLIWVVRNRTTLLAWFRARSRGLQVALASVATVVLILVATGGAVSWDYMQHDNDFCTGCHVMGPAFQRFTQSGHADLNCHDCHRQSLFASARQLHLWIKDRPQEIGEHSPVPTQICAECHINDDPADNWRQIAATAGHVAHLQSDSSALADVQCVTCHGQEVHVFRPADQTCGQANCHAEETTQIVLGGMTDAEGLHCVACHDFTAERIEVAAVDSATGPLTPGLAQCTSCHEMEELFAGYDPLLDPHEARCGACHNPHEQERPELALRSCTDAGCHARPDTLSTFHIGLPDSVAATCNDCHVPHVWTRDGNDCQACHADILAAGPRSPPSRGSLAAVAEPRGSIYRHLAVDGAPARGPSAPADVPYGPADVPYGEEAARGPPTSPAEASPVAAAALQQQAFSHREHGSVECTACHTNRTRHGEVTVRTQSDCFECHHATRTAGSAGCGGCHGPAELGRVRNVVGTLRLSVWNEERVRAQPFDHDAHTELRCVDCHGGGARQRVQTTCATCHEDHHPAAAETACATCHEEHRADAHTAEVHTSSCTGAGCHTEARFDRMERTRQFCSVCHQSMIDHEQGQPCMNCHLVPSGGSVGGREEP